MRTKHIVSKKISGIFAGAVETTNASAVIHVSLDGETMVGVTVINQVFAAADLRETAKFFNKMAASLENIL